MFKVLFTDYNYHSVELEESIIRKQIPNVEFIHAQCTTEEEVLAVAKDVDSIINQNAPISKKVIENLTNCKVIARYGVGFNTIDVEQALKKNITVCNVVDYCLNEVADHAMALIMSLTRKITFLNNQIKNGVWDYKASIPMYRLNGRILGLLSLGNISRKVANRAQAFGIKVIAYDPYVPQEVAAEVGVELVGLNELFQQSDIISVHTPLNEHTRGIVGKEAFNQMKREAFIVNTSRGPVIDENALITALETNQIAGAGLDVLEIEPIGMGNPLLKMENVILNPHVAWYSEESEEELKQKTAQNVADVLKGVVPKYIVTT